MAGTIKRGKVIRADLANWDGKTATYSRVDATGGTVSGLAIGNEVDVLQVYGSGTDRTRATIVNATNNIGTTAVTLIFAPGTWTIDSNLTIPSNFTCRIPSGCVFSVSAGVTLTFSGLVFVDYPQAWTTGAGSVSAVNAITYIRTADEITAAVTPTDYAYKPGPLLDARRFGWSQANTETQNATAIALAISVLEDNGVYGGTIQLPPGTFNCDSFDIPQFVTVRGVGGRATRLINGDTGFFIRIGGAKSGVLKYKCGLTDVYILLTHKDGHAIQLMETCGAEVKRIYAEGTTTASRANIFASIDGGDVSNFYNNIEDIIANHFEVGFRMITSGTTNATQTHFSNCNVFGDVATFPNSIGLRVAANQGSGSDWIGGNMENCGKGMIFENSCKSMNVLGARFEGCTVDAEAEPSAGVTNMVGCFINEAAITDTGYKINRVSNVNGSSLSGGSFLIGQQVMVAQSAGQTPLIVQGFSSGTDDELLVARNNLFSKVFSVTNKGKILRINNAAPATVTGSRGGNAALASLLTTLADYGLIVDSTSA